MNAPQPYHGWKNRKGERGLWLTENNVQAERVGKRFRAHVRSAKNPRGRIVRPECCTYCPRRSGEVFGSGWIVQIQACHLDYAHPFTVLWLCAGCHRKLEKGTLKWRVRDIHDYTSLVNPRPTRWVSTPF